MVLNGVLARLGTHLTSKWLVGFISAYAQNRRGQHPTHPSSSCLETQASIRRCLSACVYARLLKKLDTRRAWRTTVVLVVICTRNARKLSVLALSLSVSTSYKYRVILLATVRHPQSCEQVQKYPKQDVPPNKYYLKVLLPRRLSKMKAAFLLALSAISMVAAAPADLRAR